MDESDIEKTNNENIVDEEEKLEKELLNPFWKEKMKVPSKKSYRTQVDPSTPVRVEREIDCILGEKNKRGGIAGSRISLTMINVLSSPSVFFQSILYKDKKSCFEYSWIIFQDPWYMIEEN